MQAVARKWGNSLGIRLPNLIVRELSLKDGSALDITKDGQDIIIKPTRENKLSCLLSKINKQNLHKEIDMGASAGKEIW